MKVCRGFCNYISISFVTFRDRKVTKRSRSFSPTRCVSAKATEAISPQRLLYFSVILFHTNKLFLSSAIRRSNRTMRLYKLPCTTKTWTQYAQLYFLHRNCSDLPKKLFALHQMREDKPPRRKRGNQRKSRLI